MTPRTAIFKAYAALFWERSASVLAGPLAAIGLFLILTLLGVFERFGDPVRAISLVGLLGFAGFSVRWALSRFDAPTREEVERRLEEDSGLVGRPFEALRDAPAAGDDDLWQAHRARMAQRLETAKARRPKAAWAVIDPFGLRVTALIILMISAFWAGDRALERLGGALSPSLLLATPSSVTAEFWIEPPEYTGRPVIYLREAREAEILEGSIVAVQITGLPRIPRISGAPFEAESLSSDVQQIRLTPSEDTVIELRSGPLREALSLMVIEDTPPIVRLEGEPEGDAQGRLKLEFTAEDDFAIERFELQLAGKPSEGEPEEDAFETIAIAPGDISPTGEEGERVATLDLARHELAGQRVVVRIAAWDGAQQQGVSDPLELTLPQRIFLDPLARAVAAERRGFISVDTVYAAMPDAPRSTQTTGFLTDEPERRIERAPPQIQRLALALDAVSDAPNRYFDDPIVWIGLRTAMREVRLARELDELTHLDEDLWQIALRAELGTLADAEAALRAAEQALADAMARGADRLEISALFDAFEIAMANYLQALAREAAEAGRFAEGGGGAGGMNNDQLQALLDALREAAELGDTEGSRRALAQLLELLRNMQVTLSQGGEGSDGPESELQRAIREALEELGETVGDQRGVMGDTFDEARRQAGDEGDQAGSASEGEQGSRAPGGEESGAAGGGDESNQEAQGGSGLADRQAAIANALPGLSDRIPGEGEEADAARQALEDAQAAMEAAREALERGDAEGALGAQDEALQALREAVSAASRVLAESGQEGQDGPLGRGNQAGEGSETGVPSEMERQRARDILEELRRRAAERGRPQEELDYIDRLLERF